MKRLFFDQNCINDLLRAYPELKEEKQILDPCAGVGAFADRIEQLTKNQVDRYDIDENKAPFEQVKDYMKFRCTICGHIYDEEVEGTKFEDLPDTWVCPMCGVGKDMFEKVEEQIFTIGDGPFL